MAASSRGLTPFTLVGGRVTRDLDNHHSLQNDFLLQLPKNKKKLTVGGCWRRRTVVLKCCCSDSVVPIRRRSSGPSNSVDKCSEECRLDSKITRPNYRPRIQASSNMAFVSPPSVLSLPQLLLLRFSIIIIDDLQFVWTTRCCSTSSCPIYLFFGVFFF